TSSKVSASAWMRSMAGPEWMKRDIVPRRDCPSQLRRPQRAAARWEMRGRAVQPCPKVSLASRQETRCERFEVRPKLTAAEA
ncbi:MAG TPA: hypothetical protein VFF93_07335, partial [Luteimonas sp.]|nr:hypothetical protein [Luteimonas sp.]